MKLRDAQIAWTPGKDIEVIEKPNPALDWECTAETDLEGDQARLYAIATALKLVLRHGLRPGQVHRAMKHIDEYKSALKRYKT